MLSSPADRSSFERQCALISLCPFSVALTRSLLEAGVRSLDLEPFFAQNIAAKCVSCGMAVTGADLLAASLNSSASAETLPPKLTRLRLGYCARRSCTSNFYSLSLAPVPNINWAEICARAENWISEDTGSVEAIEPDSPTDRRITSTCLRYVKNPATICVLLALGVVLFVQGGCRIPGLSPKPRVFIVSGLLSGPAP